MTDGSTANEAPADIGIGLGDLVAFVSTTDAQRARDFYVRTLGLRLLDESAFALVLDANGTMLRVTVADRVMAAPYTVLGWSVADIAGSARALASRGVQFLRYDGMEQNELGIWRSPGGAQIAWFTDPDGNVLSLTQF